MIENRRLRINLERGNKKHRDIINRGATISYEGNLWYKTTYVSKGAPARQPSV